MGIRQSGHSASFHVDYSSNCKVSELGQDYRSGDCLRRWGDRVKVKVTQSLKVKEIKVKKLTPGAPVPGCLCDKTSMEEQSSWGEGKARKSRCGGHWSMWVGNKSCSSWLLIIWYQLWVNRGSTSENGPSSPERTGRARRESNPDS